MKVFISQPMRGKTEEQIQEERKKAIARLEKMSKVEVEIIDSYFEDYEPEGGSIPLKYLGESLKVMADADLVAFLGGWQNNRGCRIERNCCYEYNLPITDILQYPNDLYEIDVIDEKIVIRRI